MKKQEQIELNFSGISMHPENSQENEDILMQQLSRSDSNCRKIYIALKSGAMLTGAAMNQMGMLEYRRRIKDLMDAGLKIKHKTLKGGFRAWYL